MQQFINFLTGFFGTPAILIGIFCLVGCIIQHKSVAKTITSVVKTIIGFLIIAGGATLVAGAIGKFSTTFELLFNRSGWIASNDNIPGLLLSNGSLAWIATTGSIILIVGMILNLLLVKISNLKYVYLTGHSAWYFSVMIASVFQITGFNNEPQMWEIIILGSLLVSIWLTVSPYLTKRHMNIITNGQNLAIAHTGSIGYVTAGFVGELVNKIKRGNVRSTESIRFPKGLNFLRNTNVSISLTMLILFMVIYFTCWGVRGFDAMVNAGILADTDSPIVQGILQAFTFAAGVEVILIGVRTFLSELMPAFKGISERLIPGSTPSVDCPITFTFAPNAVTIGFLSSMAAGFMMLGINVAVSSTLSPTLTWSAIILPSIIPHFFTGATAGVFGNVKGGILGAILGAFVNGIIITLVPYIFVGLGYHQWAGNVIWGDADFIVGVAPGLMLTYIGKWSVYVLIITLWVLIPFVSLIKFAIKWKKDSSFRTNYLKTKEVTKNQYKLLKQQLNQRRIELKANKQTIKQTKDKTVKDDLYKKRDLINEKYEKILSGEQQEIKQNTPINVLTGTVNTKKYKFVAVCGQGLGSSMIVELNVKKTLNFLNINADVTHTNLNSFDPNDNSVDAIIVGKDLATSINFKNKIVLDNLLNQKEISEKITEFLKNKQ